MGKKQQHIGVCEYERALKIGDYDRAKYIIQNQHLIRARVDLFEIAVNKTDWTIIKYLVEEESYLETKGYLAFIAAFEKGDSVLIKYFLDKGFDINSLRSYMKKIISNGNLRKLKKLIDYGMDISYDPKKILILAVNSNVNSIEILNFLVNYGFDLTKDGVGIDLMLAAIDKHRVVIVKYLIEKGVDPTINDNAALRRACTGYRYLNMDIILVLIEAGANIYVNNLVVFTTAIRVGNRKVIDYILSFAAGKELIDRGICICAIVKNPDYDLMSYFKSLDPSPAGINKALEYASRIPNVKLLRYMITLGADPTANHSSCVIVAASRNAMKNVLFLQEHGADIHAKDELALKLACQRGHFSMVKYLIKEGADPNAKNTRCLANLKIQFKSGPNGEPSPVLGRANIKIAKYLVEMRANVMARESKILKNIVANYETTHYNILKYMIDAGADINVVWDEISELSEKIGNEKLKKLLKNK